MLGSMVTDYLARDPDLQVIASVRTREQADRLGARLPGVVIRLLDVAYPDRQSIHAVIGDAAWVVNAIGVTKPYTHDDNAAEIERAIRINALFPYELGHTAADTGARVLQIATDCVYDGVRGRYVETDPHNALDVYGKTKSLGEALLPNVHCLRSSIVGPEPMANAFLLEWFRRQPPGASVSGYTNHEWNGVTTLQCARVYHGAIKAAIGLPRLHHVVPRGTISKADLLRAFASAYDRTDIAINLTEAKTVVDRTLATSNEALNRQLWSAAGYTETPTVPQMVAELADYDFRLAGV
jgi:dTDP-4-dehydrorhamnose reductase